MTTAAATDSPLIHENGTPKSSPRDVFMYLLVILMLYTSVCALFSLVFHYIDMLFPDRLDLLPYTYQRPSDSIRFSVATLCVVFPVYVWGSRFLARDLAANPAKRDARIRKWLLYLTLFLAGLLIICDLVSLIYNFLGGELTTRFLLKVLSILVVAAAVFRFYLYELHRDPAAPARAERIYFFGGSACVAALVLIGFIVAGSPSRSRLARFDRQRVIDLQKLQQNIVDYWKKKNALPASLDRMSDNISGFTPPHDPSSGASYGYRVKGPLAFELCANFSVPSTEEPPSWQPPYGISYGNWQHGAGTVCFARSIDPDLYGKQNAQIQPRKP
jgi:hypothetical protein